MKIGNICFGDDYGVIVNRCFIYYDDSIFGSVFLEVICVLRKLKEVFEFGLSMNFVNDIVEGYCFVKLSFL